MAEQKKLRHYLGKPNDMRLALLLPFEHIAHMRRARIRRLGKVECLNQLPTILAELVEFGLLAIDHLTGIVVFSGYRLIFPNIEHGTDLPAAHPATAQELIPFFVTDVKY